MVLFFALIVGHSSGSGFPAYRPQEDQGQSQVSQLDAKIRKQAQALEEKLISWRRDIHEHPELGDQESRTPKLIAAHLRHLGLEVRTGIGRTGVVGILKGGKSGRTVALRADMDALPVKEPPGLPFASKAVGEFHGMMVSVMHACGHDAHTAMLMAAAEILAGMKDELAGTVVFIFQPAEEGSSLFKASTGKIAGARLMLEEGLFKELKPDAVFGLHVMHGPSGEISFRSGPVMACSDSLEITITGKQGHGGMPWNAVDPVTTSALVITGLQTVVSRKANLTASPVVVTIGTINGGTATNIIPDLVRMTGTIRAYDEQVRDQVHREIRQTAEKIAESAGATAKVTITRGYDPTVNDETLTARMAPVLERVADGRIRKAPMMCAAEDFAFFAKVTPGLYLFLGVTPQGQDPILAAPIHSPNFFVDEKALVVGTRTLASLAVNFLMDEKNKSLEKPK
jgi:amidohydrolase